MNYQTELDFIKEQMQAAFRDYGNADFSTEQKSAFDLVTDIDVNIEKALSAAIRAKFPSDKILGEEFSSSEVVSGRTWTVDPIDGTCNMASGSKLFGLQCSLIEDGEIVVGVVYLPHFDEWIYASKDSGCYFNGKRVKVASETKVNNAIVSFGDYPHGKGQIADIQHAAIKRLYTQIAKIRMFGAACMDFAFVAQGRTHGTVVITKNLWDIAPGILLCKEAGAVVTDLKGLHYRFGTDGVVATANKQLSALITGSFEQHIVLGGHSFSACIFDFDGVIADTEKYHLAAWRKGFEKFGLTLTDSEYIPLISTGKDNIIAFVEKKRGKKFSEKEKTEIYETKKAAFKQYFADMGERDLIGGAKEFLSALSTRLVKTAVASSASSTAALIDRLSLNGLFDVSFDGNDGFKKKPAPDIFLACAEKLKVEPKDCVVFEDSFAGIEAAIKAGMEVVAVGIDDKRALMKISDFRCLL